MIITSVSAPGFDEVSFLVGEGHVAKKKQKTTDGHL